MIVDLSKLQPPAEPPRPRLTYRKLGGPPTFQQTEHLTWKLMRFYSVISLRMEPYRTAARPCEPSDTADHPFVYSNEDLPAGSFSKFCGKCGETGSWHPGHPGYGGDGAPVFYESNLGGVRVRHNYPPKGPARRRR